MDEAALVRFYTSLTGETETAARSVVMYLDMLQENYFPNQTGLSWRRPTVVEEKASPEPARDQLRNIRPRIASA